MQNWHPPRRQEKPQTSIHLRISEEFFALIATGMYLLTIEARSFVTFRQAVAESCRRVLQSSEEMVSALVCDFERSHYAGKRVLSFGASMAEHAELVRIRELLIGLSGNRFTNRDTVALAMIHLLEQKRWEGIGVSWTLPHGPE